MNTKKGFWVPIIIRNQIGGRLPCQQVLEDTAEASSKRWATAIFCLKFCSQPLCQTVAEVDEGSLGMQGCECFLPLYCLSLESARRKTASLTGREGGTRRKKLGSGVGSVERAAYATGARGTAPVGRKWEPEGWLLPYMENVLRIRWTVWEELRN